MSVDAVLIAGPTASGKSGVALALAQAIGGTIINTDSMQVYAEARILTARPAAEDERRAPHLLYGHKSVRDRYSAGQYREDAAAALKAVRASGRTPIFVGGTGMYFTVLSDGIAEIPVVPPPTRRRTEELRRTWGAEKFHAELRKRDPETAARLRPSDTQRNLRAFEVYEATGEPLSFWQKRMGAPVLKDMKVARFVIAPDRAELHRRIAARFDRMVAEGGLEEAAALRFLDPSLPAAKILGLRELAAVHAGTLTLQEATGRAQAATRQYAKRQTTWFRQRMRDWTWMEMPDAGAIAARVGA